MGYSSGSVQPRISRLAWFAARLALGHRHVFVEQFGGERVIERAR